MRMISHGQPSQEKIVISTDNHTLFGNRGYISLELLTIMYRNNILDIGTNVGEQDRNTNTKKAVSMATLDEREAEGGK